MLTITPTKDHHLLATLNQEVQQLHQEMHPQIFKPYDKDAISEAIRVFLADPNCEAYLAMEGEEAVGYMICFVKEAKENAFKYSSRSYYIDQVGVPAKHRRKGIAERLLNKAEELARERGLDRLELDHWSTNLVAAAYFRKHGYEIYREMLWKDIK